MQHKSLETINLDEVTSYAALLYTPERVALAMELEYDAVEEAMQDRDHPFYRAYWKGYISSEAPIRASIIKLAKSASSPAQAQAMKILDANEVRRAI